MFIVSHKRSMPNRRHVIISTCDLVYWCINASVGLNVLTYWPLADVVVIFTRGQLWPSDIVIASVCVCVCMCVCVCQSSVCPDDNLSPAQTTITKFGPEVQNTLIKIPIVPYWGSLTLNVKVKLNQKCILALLRSLLILGLIDLDIQFHF